MRFQNKPGRFLLIFDEKDLPLTIDAFMDRFLQSSKNRYLLKQDSSFTLNHKHITDFSTELKAHDQLMIPNHPSDAGFPEAGKECKVVYEDDFVYAVHKNPGCIIYGEPEDRKCLAAQAAAWQANHGIHTPVRYLHRLDEATAGLVLFSKIPFFQPWLDSQMEQKKIERHYLAVTTGTCKLRQLFTFNQAIGKDRHINGKYRVSATGKQACTRAVCVAKSGPLLLFSCNLLTGRTHQIRVHLSNAGFPIVNDPLYGTPNSGFEEMGLWADQLTYIHPLTGVSITINDIPNPAYERFAYKIEH